MDLKKKIVRVKNNIIENKEIIAISATAIAAGSLLVLTAQKSIAAAKEAQALARDLLDDKRTVIEAARESKESGRPVIMEDSKGKPLFMIYVPNED